MLINLRVALVEVRERERREDALMRQLDAGRNILEKSKGRLMEESVTALRDGCALMVSLRTWNF